jgi:hypothetical protein
MKRLITAAAAVAAMTFGLAAAQAHSGGKVNLFPTAANSSSPLDATDMSAAKKKKMKKSMRGAGRSGTSKAGTGGGAGGESGSGSAARGAQGRGPTR